MSPSNEPVPVDIVAQVADLRTKLMKPMFVFAMASAKADSFPGAVATREKAAAEVKRVVLAWVFETAHQNVEADLSEIAAEVQSQAQLWSEEAS